MDNCGEGLIGESNTGLGARGAQDALRKQMMERFQRDMSSQWGISVMVSTAMMEATTVTLASVSVLAYGGQYCLLRAHYTTHFRQRLRAFCRSGHEQLAHVYIDE
jgi:hypothetical protein